MAWDFCTTTEPKARKDYHCEAWDWVGELDEYHEMDDSDRAIVETARKENFKILKGTNYIKTEGKFEGNFCTFRARKDLDSICKKYKLYDNY